MEETAFGWIRRHKEQYEVKTLESDFDVSLLLFATIEPPTPSYAMLGRKGSKYSVMINLDTAADCEALCKLLRVQPEPV